MIRTEPITVPRRATHGWLKLFFAGVVFYFLSLAIMVLTGNPNLFPTVVLIGNFLVPVTYVAFLYEHRHLSRLSLPSVASTFFYGGLLGILASALLEPIFVRPMDPASVLAVGIIEEGAKILGVLLIAWRKRPVSEMDGLIMGAAAGMGFAALESMGYTFTAFLLSHGSLSVTVMTTMIRGFLAPLGHGTWTAIIASVVFRQMHGERFHFNLRVWVAFFGVAFLHALWDGIPPVIDFIFSSGLAVLTVQLGLGLLGASILWLRWRSARHHQLAAASATHL